MKMKTVTVTAHYNSWSRTNDVYGNPTSRFDVWLNGVCVCAPTRRGQVGYSGVRHQAAEVALVKALDAAYGDGGWTIAPDPANPGTFEANRGTRWYTIFTGEGHQPNAGPESQARAGFVAFMKAQAAQLERAIGDCMAGVPPDQMAATVQAVMALSCGNDADKMRAFRQLAMEITYFMLAEVDPSILEV
jgi:hypothetical protein